MTSAIPTICLWIPFVLKSTLPRNATLGGWYTHGDTKEAYHLYVARTWDDGELVQVHQANDGSIAAVDFKRGTSEPIRLVDIAPKNGDLLTCNTEIAVLRWLKFQPKMDLDNCIAYGKAQSGETGYVGRTFVKSQFYKLLYGSVPGFFLPSEGCITVWLWGMHYSCDVELLCVI